MNLQRMLIIDLRTKVTHSLIESLMDLFQAGSMFNMQGSDPIWGNAKMNEIVDACLGAKGVI